MAVEVESFDAAITRAKGFGGAKHVLLGNGFSIDCRPDLFTYGSLLDKADFSGMSLDGREIFKLLKTPDFEQVIAALRLAADLIEAYKVDDANAAKRLRSDAETLKNALAEVLSRQHPDRPADISLDEYDHAIVFLRNFDRVYSLNYDLMLYWVIMHDTAQSIPRDDGFRADGSPEYVVWDPYEVFRTQRVFYLHGALHLYDDGTDIQKYRWAGENPPLVDQIREALNIGKFPIVVTEGSSQEKIEKILHNPYLNHSIRTLEPLRGNLFVFGHSLSPNDAHLFDRVINSGISHVFISLFGDPNSQANRKVVAAAGEMQTRRGTVAPLETHFFDAETAHVWH